jgi:beta-aspartyl-dipeptidase (metallo-type)
MYLIPEIIGVGEPAISDKRSSQVTTDDLTKLVADVHVAGRLSGKLGFVQFHLGDAPTGMQPLFDILPNVDIKHIVPLHCNRNKQVLSESVSWAEKGGIIDLTVPLFPPAYKLGFSVSDAIEYLKKHSADVRQITVSSDGNGVSTLYGKDYIHRFPLNILYEDIKRLIEHGTDVAEAVSYVTANVADGYGMQNKGRIQPDKDADILVIEPEDFRLRHVISCGHIVVENGVLLPPPHGIDA